MLSYRVMLDVPVHLVLFVARLLAAHRREIGTRRGTRALSTWRQAVFALAWFRDRPDVARLGRGFGISQATAYRYLDEAITVLAARAPALRETLEQAKDHGLPHLILDGKVVAADRCKEKTVSRKGKQIDRWYSGKARGILRPYLKDLPVLADSGYEGAGCGIHVPVRRPAGGGELDLNTRTRNALLCSLRCLGERGLALMSQRWRTLQRVMLSPGKIGDIARGRPRPRPVRAQDDHLKVAEEPPASRLTAAVAEPPERSEKRAATIPS